jgi:hypothetical protein
VTSQRVEGDLAWTEAIGARFLQTGRRITENHIHLDYQGSEAAGALIEDYFGDPSWLVAERKGPLPWNGRRGDLVIEVVDSAGDILTEVECEVTAEDPEAEAGSEVFVGTGDDGQCRFDDLPAVPYRVVLRVLDDGEYVTAREARVVVTPPATATRVEVDPASTP